MSHEPAGRSDKLGNRFEYNWIIKQLLDVVDEKILSVKMEPLGEDEKGVDLWLTLKNRKREAHQCKSRNGSEGCWSFSALKSNGVWKNWKIQLSRPERYTVVLVSPVNFPLLQDIVQRARTNGNNARAFYCEQIQKSGMDLQLLFEQVCGEMDIDLETEEGIERSLDFFQRIKIRLVNDELKEEILDKIHMLFVGDPQTIYRIFLDFITNDDVYEHEIDFQRIDSLLKNENVEYRLLSKNENIYPCMRTLNDAYKESFHELSYGFIERIETEKCIDFINDSKSVIVHGSAGVGKSGCLANLIKVFEANGTPYLAINLDMYVPEGDTEKWGKELGLPASISYCMNAITSKRAVIILDQLDGMRWTQAHSRNALNVCVQVIKEIFQINKERENPISMVFSCRTYDYLNDPTIRELFSKEGCWREVEISLLPEQTVRKVVGDKYDNYSDKLKALLRYPSNLFIWERLEDKEACRDCTTTYQLVYEWWREATSVEKIASHSFRADALESIKDDIVASCNRLSRVRVPRAMVNIPKEYEEYMMSLGFLRVDRSSVAFAHQSILDCFIAEEMINQYFSGTDLVDVVGKKQKQTPSRRYQFQIFMQQVFDYSVADFISLGRKLLKCAEMRFSFKFVYLEVLAQVLSMTEEILGCICELLNNPEWKLHTLKVIIPNHAECIHMIRDIGLLEGLINDPKTQKLAVEIISSNKNVYDSKDIEFINKYISIPGMQTCFGLNYYDDSDELFELRMKLYDKYPNLVDRYSHLNEMIKKNEQRTILLFGMMLQKHICKDDEEAVVHDYSADLSKLNIREYRVTLDTILPYIPQEAINTFSSMWSARNKCKIGIERASVMLCKAAAYKFAQSDPRGFFDYFAFADGKGYGVVNEIILYGMRGLDNTYSDYVLDYISKDRLVNTFISTSEEHDRLHYAKELVKHFSVSCGCDALSCFVSRVIKYVGKDDVDRLRKRIEYNHEDKGKGHGHRYSIFWGITQYKLLSSICESRREEYVRDVLSTLSRRPYIYESEEDLGYAHESGDTISPVHERKLAPRDWMHIITSSNLDRVPKSRFDYKNKVCVDYNLHSYLMEYRDCVCANASEMIDEMCTASSKGIREEFVHAFLSEISSDNVVRSLDEDKSRMIINCFRDKTDVERELNILHIIDKTKIVKDIKFFSDIVVDMILSHKDNLSKTMAEFTKYRLGERADYLDMVILNSPSGEATFILSKILNLDRMVFDEYRDVINGISSSENMVQRYAALFVLWASFQCEPKWASNKILEIYNGCEILLNFPAARHTLYNSYQYNGSDVEAIIRRSLNSEYSKIKRMASYCSVDLFMNQKCFDDIYEVYVSQGTTNRHDMLYMIIVYYKDSKYRDKARGLLEDIISVEQGGDNDVLWSGLFDEDIMDLNDDYDLINKILLSKASRYIISSFYEYVRKKRSIKLFADEILYMSDSVIDSYDINSTEWMLDVELCKLIIELYDEVSTGSTERDKYISFACLDLWDKMYERNIYGARILTRQMQQNSFV